MGGVEQFRQEDYPLFSVHVDSWAYLIFVNLSETSRRHPCSLVESFSVRWPRHICL